MWTYLSIEFLCHYYYVYPYSLVNHLLSLYFLQAWRHVVSVPFRLLHLLRGGDGHGHPANIFIATVHLVIFLIVHHDPSVLLITPGPGGWNWSVSDQARRQDLQEQRSPTVRRRRPRVACIVKSFSQISNGPHLVTDVAMVPLENVCTVYR